MTVIEQATPLPHQTECIDLVGEFGGRAIIADEMGLGKTLTSLWSAQRYGWWPTLVVCPASLKYNWEHEALTHLGIRASVCEGRTPPTWSQMDGARPDLTIINYDIIRDWAPYLARQGFRLLILDECQNLNNPEAKRSKAVSELARGIPHLLAMSGTPIENRPIEFFSVLSMLWPDEFDSLWSFAQEYCRPRFRPWGWDFGGASNANELHQRLQTLGMIRRKKKAILTELPDKVYRIRSMPLSDPDQYILARDDFESWLKQNMAHKLRSASRAKSLTQVGYLLTLAAKLKMRAAVDDINRSLHQTNDKIVLFAVHRKAIDLLRRRVEGKSVVVDGSVKGRRRQTAVNQFQKDPETRVFIGNIKAAGVGLTLTASSDVRFLEFWYNPASHEQAADRVHRIGQTEIAEISYYVGEGTIEMELCKILQKKQQTVTSILDGGTAVNGFNLHDELMYALQGRLKL